jgi:hypothetical protein
MNIKKEFTVLLNRIFILIILLSPQYALARFLFEPSFMQYTGRFDGENGRGNLSGQVFGLNTGYLGENFMIGLTVEKGQYKYDSNITSAGHENFDGGGLGSFIGFHLFDHFKIWTGYLNSSLEPTSNNDTRYFGQQVSFGIGYRVYEGLMLNLHSFSNQFTQFEDDNTGKTTGLSRNIKTEGHVLSASYLLIF